MYQSTITINKDKTMVKADSANAAFQMFNESVISKHEQKPIKVDHWYKINGSYALWVLENEFPTTKGGEFINIVNE